MKESKIEVLTITEDMLKLMGIKHKVVHDKERNRVGYAVSKENYMKLEAVLQSGQAWLPVVVETRDIKRNFTVV